MTPELHYKGAKVTGHIALHSRLWIRTDSPDLQQTQKDTTTERKTRISDYISSVSVENSASSADDGRETNREQTSRAKDNQQPSQSRIRSLSSSTLAEPNRRWNANQENPGEIPTFPRGNQVPDGCGEHSNSGGTPDCRRLKSVTMTSSNIKHSGSIPSI